MKDSTYFAALQNVHDGGRTTLNSHSQFSDTGVHALKTNFERDYRKAFPGEDLSIVELKRISEHCVRIVFERKE